MFRKHPLRDFMLFLLVGITITFGFNVRAVDTDQNTTHTPHTTTLSQHY